MRKNKKCHFDLVVLQHLFQIADEEEAKLISAPSEIYDSPRSTPRDLALIDLTLSAAVTAYDLGEEDADTEGAPPAQEKKKRMTPSMATFSFFRGVMTPLSSSYNIPGLVPVCWLLFQCFCLRPAKLQKVDYFAPVRGLF